MPTPDRKVISMTEPRSYPEPYTPEFIDRAVQAAFAGRGNGRPGAPSLHPVSREFGIPVSTLRNWVYRAERRTPAGSDTPPSQPPERAGRRSSGRPSTLARALDLQRHLGNRVTQLSRECERLSAENAALTVALLVLARRLESERPEVRAD